MGCGLCGYTCYLTLFSIEDRLQSFACRNLSMLFSTPTQLADSCINFSASVLPFLAVLLKPQIDFLCFQDDDLIIDMYCSGIQKLVLNVYPFEARV